MPEESPLTRDKGVDDGLVLCHLCSELFEPGMWWVLVESDLELVLVDNVALGDGVDLLQRLGDGCRWRGEGEDVGGDGGGGRGAWRRRGERGDGLLFYCLLLLLLLLVMNKGRWWMWMGSRPDGIRR